MVALQVWCSTPVFIFMKHSSSPDLVNKVVDSQLSWSHDLLLSFPLYICFQIHNRSQARLKRFLLWRAFIYFGIVRRRILRSENYISHFGDPLVDIKTLAFRYFLSLNKPGVHPPVFWKNNPRWFVYQLHLLCLPRLRFLWHNQLLRLVARVRNALSIPHVALVSSASTLENSK